MLDWWEKREVERRLAQELNLAQQAFQLANFRLREATVLAGSGSQHSDPNLPVLQARLECEHTYAVWMHALNRWTEFVKHGGIPEDASSQEHGSVA